MGFSYLTNVDLDKAVKDYCQTLTANGLKPQEETVFVPDALGRIASEAVYACICAPHYNACAMDGIAVNSSITFGATETTPVYLKETDFVYVDTGDPLPENCDAVIMIEDVIQEDNQVKIYQSAVPWQYVRQIGEDISAGDMIFPSYTVIRPAEIGVMLASGVMKLKVFKKPVVGIIPTGDEIVKPTPNPKCGDIIEFNSSIFCGMLREMGAIPKVYDIVPDKLPLIQASVEKTLKECDVVILNAGSSAGREDFSTQVIRNVGEVLYHGIAIKPGKPAILGYAKEKPILGVPGYPLSGIIVIEQILKPVLKIMCGNIYDRENIEEVVLAKRLNSSLKYREFIHTRLGYVDNQLIAVPINKGAGVVSSMIKADGIIDVSQDCEGYETETKVSVRLLKSKQEIKKMLLITGSHDPLIDEVADIMMRNYPGYQIASTHVGSMGAFMALKRREAHLGGIHVLDQEAGLYNQSYIKKYFSFGGVVLIEGVRRLQGLMIRKGNPKGITSLKNIKEQKLSYVNRQKGSGTRILLDYLLKKEGISSSEIYGYTREEFTHTNVAAVIASGSGDVGMGIYSAAQIYDLDFIPICEEEYDFLVAESALDLSVYKHFIEILQGEEFRNRVQKMGGYRLHNPGQVKQ